MLVYPSDPKFSLGVWRVAVHAALYNGEIQRLGIKLTLKEAKPITELSNSQGPITSTVTDSVFFKYTIQDLSDLDNQLLLLNISKRKDLQIYIHRIEYPSDQFMDYEYALGDIPPHVMSNLSKVVYMKEMY